MGIRECALEQATLNVLVVDDDEFFAGVVSNQIRAEYKHRTTIVRDGSEAKKLLENGDGHFDIILTDYDMPEMSGLDLLRWMQQQKIEIPVVVLTAAGSETVAVEAMRLGAYDYVRKEQLDLQHLGIVINSTHERRQLRIARVIEEERSHEVDLNLMATDKVRDLLNALTPKLNAALAGIHSDLEMQGEQLYNQLPMMQQREFRQFLQHINHETVVLESSIRGLLKLYRMLYAHHTSAEDFDRIKNEIESIVKPS
jgi:DNA-binding NtrC family response regulator